MDIDYVHSVSCPHCKKPVEIQLKYDTKLTKPQHVPPTARSSMLKDKNLTGKFRKFKKILLSKAKKEISSAMVKKIAKEHGITSIKDVETMLEILMIQDDIYQPKKGRFKAI